MFVNSYIRLGQSDAEFDESRQTGERNSTSQNNVLNTAQRIKNVFRVSAAFLVRHAVVFVSFLIIAVVVGISLGLGLYAFLVVEPRPEVDFSIKAFSIPNHLTSQRQDALDAARTDAFNGRKKRFAEDDDVVENIGHNLRRSRSICGYWQFVRRQRIQLVYLTTNDDDNIFRKDYLEFVHGIENEIVQFSNFTDFCFMNLAACECTPLNSLLTYFYPSRRPDGSLNADGRGPTLMDVDTALNWAMSSNPKVYWYTDGRLSAMFHRSRFLRSEIQFGYPIKGYLYYDDNLQKEAFNNFAISLVKFLSTKSTDKVRVLYGGNEIFDYEVNQAFWNDLRLAIFSLVFIFIFVFILSSFSFWLTFFGIVTIFLSFPLAFFFYRVVFGFVAVGILNGVAVFVIIGIGVDDIFVFINTFRQSHHMSSLSKRMKHTIKTSGRATFFTSFTTAAAFAANISSSIPAVHEFGLFMTLMVTCCWLLVLLLMPPVICIWYQWFGCCENRIYGSCCWRSRLTSYLKLPEDISHFLECRPPPSEEPSTSVLNVNRGDSGDDDVALLRLEEEGEEEETNTSDAVSSDEMDDPMLRLEEECRLEERKEATEKKEGCSLSLFFQGILYHYVAIPVIKARWVLSVIFIVILALSIGCLSQLRHATKPPQLFKGNTNLQTLLDLVANYSSQGLSCDECSGYYKSYSNPIPVPPPMPTTYSTGEDARSTNSFTAFTTRTTSQPSTASTLSRTSPLTSTTANTLNPLSIPTSAVLSASTTTTATTTTTTTKTTTTTTTTTRSVSVLPSTSQPTTGTSTTSDGIVNPCAGNQCDKIEDHPPLESGIVVNVVFGIKGMDKSNISFSHVLSEKGTVIYDDEFARQFSLSNNLNFTLRLSELCRMCKAIANNSDLVTPNTSQCWPSNADAIVLQIFSLNSECKDIPQFYMDKGVMRPSQVQAGYSQGVLHWIAFSFQARTLKGQSSFSAYKEYQDWETFMKRLTETLSSDSPFRSMFQTSDFWRQVMMEVVAVSSAIYGLVLSMLICVLAVAIFTGHFFLLFITLLTMIGLLCLVLAVFFLLGWEIGAIEAISLSILVGSSVDYCVHIVEGYLLAGKNPPPTLSHDNSGLRRWRTSAAVSHIGTSVVSSALTTIMAAIPLTQTTILPFSRFGEILAINATVSIAYTLTFCVAFLGISAPPKFTNGFRSAGIMLAAMAIFTGFIFLILFIISRCGVEIPAPDGQDLFPN